jgi:ACS family glucarate transporter-like MFS transporter
MGIGSALGNLCGAGMLAAMSWRWMFVICSIPGFVWAIWFWFWFRDRPEEHQSVNREELELIHGPAAKTSAPRASGAPGDESSIWLSLTLWGIAGQQFFRACAAVLYITWFPGYLERTYKIGIEQVGIFGSLPLWVMLGGAILGGVLSDRVTNRSGSRTVGRKGFALVCTAAGGLSMLVVAWLPDLREAIVMICVSTLLTALAGPCAYAVSLDTGGHRAGKVFATMNMAGNIGAMLFPLAMTRFVKWYGDWSCLPWFVAALLLLSALCWLPVNANRVIGTHHSLPAL